MQTHALSLRRKVQGRRKPFDDLLKEHRATKEALQKYKAEQKANELASKGIIGGTSKLGHVPVSASPIVPSATAASKSSLSHILTHHITGSTTPGLSKSFSGSTSPQKPVLPKPHKTTSNHFFAR